MRFAQRVAVLISLVCVAGAQPPQQKLMVAGKLVRVMAIGAESTGWAIELVAPITIENTQVNSIQVRYSSASKLERLASKQVRASGKLVHRQGVETGNHPVLDISSIKEVKAKADTASAQPKSP